MEIKNTQKKYAQAMGYVSLVGLTMTLAPWLFNIDPMNGGGAMLMVGLLIALTGLISYAIFRGRAKQMDAVIKNQNVIARWKIDSMEWQQFVETDNQALRKGAMTTWFIITFFFVLFTAFFWFITEDNDDANFFLILMGAVYLFISVFAFLATRTRTNSRSNQNDAEIIIADNCLVLNNEFHVWKGLGANLESVNYYEADRILEFTYSFPARGGKQYQEVRVPVPLKEKAQLDRVLKHFGIKPLEFSSFEANEDQVGSGEHPFNNEENGEGFEVKF